MWYLHLYLKHKIKMSLEIFLDCCKILQKQTNKTKSEPFRSQNACASVVVDNHFITARAAYTEKRKLCLPNGHETSGQIKICFY